MESIHVHQRLRPRRYAFLIRDGDSEAAMQAVSLNTAIWGGIYNPIVPLMPADECHGLLREFDPDKLINLTNEDLNAELQHKYEHRIIPQNELVTRDYRSGKKHLQLGFNMVPILRQIYQSETKSLVGPSRASLISTGAGDGWPEYVGFVFGTFSYLPQSDIDLLENFKKALRPQEVLLDPANFPSNLSEMVNPIQLTRYGLQSFSRLARFSSHIIYIGDHRNLTDLIEFWNIRTTGRTIVFVPMASYKSWEQLVRLVADQGRYPINPQLENSADLQKAPSISDDVFREVCDWIATLDIGRLPGRNWRPTFGDSIDYYVGDIHPVDVESQTSEEISILQDAQMTPVKLIVPNYIKDGPYRDGYNWSIEISMDGSWNNDFTFAFPAELEVEKVVRRSTITSGECHIGRNGLVIKQHSFTGRLYLRPARTEDVFFALFKQFGFEAEPSEPGRYADQIIRKMGQLEFDCRVFKLRGLRQILDELSKGSTLTKGNMYQFVMSQTPDKYGTNWRPDIYEDIFGGGAGRGTDFTNVFNTLLEKKIIRPGFTLKCPRCYAEDWYHISEFHEEYTCRFCFTAQPVNFGSLRDWQYKADGLFRLPDSARGSIAVILSLWRLNHLHSMAEARYLTSVNLKEVEANQYFELDYAFLKMGFMDTSYELVLGEASRFGDFIESDIQKLRHLSEKFDESPFLRFRR